MKTTRIEVENGCDISNGCGSDKTCNESSCLLPKKNSSGNTTSTSSEASFESSQSSQASPAPALAQCSYVSPTTNISKLPIRTTRASNNGGVNFSTNTLLVYRLQDMRSLSNTNLYLAILCLIYMGVNVTLVCVNYINDAYVKTHGGLEEGEPVDDTIYHLVEFWATFGFAVVECIALAVTPKSQYSINGNMDPLFLRMVMFVNIVATAVPAVMVSFSIETFERASHEIEYINELTMSFVDVILLLSLWKSKSSTSSSSALGHYKIDETTENSSGQAWYTAAIALVVAMVQLGVYNLMGYDEARDDMVGEVPAHFLEFSFEIISSLIAFWFCMDNKAVADKEIGMILYGNHEEDCQICNNQITEFALDHRGTSMPPRVPLVASSTYYQTV